MNSEAEPIYTLIAAYLCGEKLTTAEEEELRQWKNASEHNLQLYNYYRNLFERRNTLSQWENVTLPSAEVYARIFSNRTKKRKAIWKMLKYAAVVIPVLCISTWLFYRQSIHIPPTAVQTTGLQDIAPGKQKAHLTLENGETLSLTDSGMAIASHKNIQVDSGGVLRYAENNRPEKRKTVYHTLRVERGAEFQLILPDGTKVWLNSDSELKYPNVFDGSTRSVYLKGEAYFEVKHSDAQPFIVNAGEYAIRVLGTAFNVSSYEQDKEIVTTLAEGKIAYTAGPQQGELLPGEQCIFAKEAKTVKVKKVNVAPYISWKNGLFIFDCTSMEDLAKQIARWYDIEIFFPDDAARKVSFTGAMERYKPVSYFIEMINATNTAECRLEGNILVFRKK